MSDESSDLELYKREVHSFLLRHVSPRADAGAVVGEVSDEVGIFEKRDGEDAAVTLAQAKSWRATKFDAGYGWIDGPTEYGGAGLTAAHREAFEALEATFDVPSEGVFGIGLGMVAPTIAAFASEDLKHRYLPSFYRGDIIGCQLFSEPGAGSDLASVQTRAIRDGDDWLISGQKVWTSGAQYSDIGEIMCRTEPSAPKHRGLTVFLIDMHTPGVEVRPLRQITGGSTFNEVFLTDVRVPDDHRLGEINDGWSVATGTLTKERAAIGAGPAGGNSDRLVALVAELAKRTAGSRAGQAAAQLAETRIRHQVLKAFAERSRARAVAGESLGPEMSIAKLLHTELLSSISATAIACLGTKAFTDVGEWGTHAWSQLVLGVPGARIGGGTDEIQLNIIAERVLGLPREKLPTPQTSTGSSAQEASS